MREAGPFNREWVRVRPSLEGIDEINEIGDIGEIVGGTRVPFWPKAL